MPDKIRLNEDRGIIEIESYSVITKVDIAESISKVQQILNDKGINKILVDTTKQDTMPSTLAIFDLYSTFPQEFRIAILIQKSQVTAEDISSAETVAVNRGVLMKVFCEKEPALQWLDNG